MIHSQRSRSTLIRFATCALAGALAWACNGSDDDPATSSATDAGTDTQLDSGAHHADSDAQNEAALPTDAKTEPETSSEDASSITCELLANGTCSPPAQPTEAGCSGCYRVTGRRYDTVAKCLLDDLAVPITCTTLCEGYGGRCYERVVDGATEVVAMEQSFENPKFEQETGFTPCNDTLSTEVMTAPDCP